MSISMSIFDLGNELGKHIPFVIQKIEGQEERCVHVVTQSWPASSVRPFCRRWVYLAPNRTVVVRKELFLNGLDEEPAKSTLVLEWDRLPLKAQRFLERAAEDAEERLSALKGTLDI